MSDTENLASFPGLMILRLFLRGESITLGKSTHPHPHRKVCLSPIINKASLRIRQRALQKSTAGHGCPAPADTSTTQLPVQGTSQEEEQKNLGARGPGSLL